MDGKDAIIQSIIASAEKKAEAIVSDAMAEKDAAIEKTRNELERKEREALAAAREEAKLSVGRRVTLAELDKKKMLLKAKQSVIDKVYDAAITKTLNMTDNVYRDFLGELIRRYADDGDEIIVAERDVRRLSYDWATELGRSIGKELSLSTKRHGGRGGIILSGYKCDKNLTLDTLLSEIRPSTEGEIAERLFGGK